MALPTKHSVAVLILHENQILAIRRPDDDDELPGIWGLPAGTRRKLEDIKDVIRRIGRDKLGVELHPLRKLESGSQARPGYLLDMELWQAAMDGVPTCQNWKWTDCSLLREGASKGSLCCDLALKNEGRVS